MSQFLQISEDGYPVLNQKLITDCSSGLQIFKNLKRVDKRWMTHFEGESYYVEPFDQVLVAQHVKQKENGALILQFPFEIEKPLSLQNLFVDEWDRFLGYTTEESSPDHEYTFVLSDEAQGELFDLVDSYDDNSITYEGHRHVLESWYKADGEVEFSKFWSQVYQQENPPGWELNQHNPVLNDVIKQLKLPRSRVAVLGCGSGNDAAFFAEHGHIVTAFDFSEKALEQAKTKYGHVQDLKWVQQDVFSLNKEYTQSFDLVFDHTLYCAVNPQKRNDLVQVWRNLLVEEGFLLGIFFSMDHRSGPPYGGSEWELRKRIHNKFHSIYWNRCHNSLGQRLGREFLVYAQKINQF